MDHTTDRLRPGNRNTSGETLVETLVAFAVLMVLLTLVTTAVSASASMTGRAIAQVNSLEASGLTAETDGGATLPDRAKLTITFPADSGLTFSGESEHMREAELPVVVKRAGEDPALLYFTEGGGG